MMYNIECLINGQRFNLVRHGSTPDKAKALLLSDYEGDKVQVTLITRCETTGE